jgi:poly [ADP-ribose] polymerase 2/3/4
MGKIKVIKKKNNLNDGFVETIKYYVMHQANVENNHNKFYSVELQKHPDGRYRIYTNYGRLGISEIHEIRDTINGDPIYDLDIIEKEFESIHKKKLRGKSVINKETGKKERECYVDIDVVAPQVGSENIRGKSEVKKQVTIKAAIDTSSYDAAISKLIDQLVDENIHSITSMTSIKYTANGYATELGPVTPDHVSKARKVLDELNNLMDKDGNINPDNQKVKKTNSLFFSLIPKPFSRKISSDDMILDAKKVQDEYDILDQLATGVQMGAAMQQNTAARMNALGTDVEILKDHKEANRIIKYIESSKAANHRGTNVWGYKVKNIYKIRIPEERKKYDKVFKKFGNIEEVFHGSANSNILSIIKSGLIIPKSNAPHVCGRMHGDGVYGANNSTKSLNYSIGFWGGRRSKYRNNFLFLADFAMGKTYVTQSTNPYGPPKGYDSVWAKKGRNLYNDELIVYSLPQCTLKYLVEMEK